ncbi:MAG: hypothetical protein KGI73_04725 [Patescibacteria group bacterium]|nr:hypothetical protein [Patescibacteria group bacterium]
MAFPQNNIEQMLRREPASTASGWSVQLLMFASTVFVITLVVYFGLVYGYTPYLQAQRDKLDQQIQTFSEQVPAADQEKIIGFYSQIANIQTLLSGHVLSTPVFGWLESHTSPNVYYAGLQVDVAGGKLSLSAVAATMADVETQIKVFETAPEVQSVVLGGIAQDKSGAWDFSAALAMAPGFFRQSNATSTP